MGIRAARPSAALSMSNACVLKSVAGHQRTADTPAGGGRADTPAGGGQADTPAGGEQAGAILRTGMHACAMGEGRIRREPQHGGRKDASAAAPRIYALTTGVCYKRGASTIAGYNALMYGGLLLQVFPCIYDGKGLVRGCA
jgi:hypothetical protein